MITITSYTNPSPSESEQRTKNREQNAIFCSLFFALCSRSDKAKIMQKIQTQGLHHITLVGASRQVSIDFWEGVLGMPFIFEQPNLDRPDQSHLYFDPG